MKIVLFYYMLIWGAVLLPIFRKQILNVIGKPFNHLPRGPFNHLPRGPFMDTVCLTVLIPLLLVLSFAIFILYIIFVPMIVLLALTNIVANIGGVASIIITFAQIFILVYAIIKIKAKRMERQCAR